MYINSTLYIVLKQIVVIDDTTGCSKLINFVRWSELLKICPVECVGSSEHCRQEHCLGDEYSYNALHWKPERKRDR